MTNKKLYALTDEEVEYLTTQDRDCDLDKWEAMMFSFKNPVAKVYLVEARWLADTPTGTGMDTEVMMVALSFEHAAELIKESRRRDGKLSAHQAGDIGWWAVVPESVGVVDITIEHSKLFDLDGNPLTSQPWR